MKTHKFARKTFYVDAARVSELNIEEVASWCSGTIKQDQTGHTYIDVNVDRPLNDRQTQAYVGDWVLASVNGKGFKVYTPKAFDKSFEKVKTLTKEQADAAGVTVPHEPRPSNENGNRKDKKPIPTPPKKRPAPKKQRDKRVGNVGQALKEAQAKVTDETSSDATEPAIKSTETGAGVDYRSAETGQYVTEETAEKNPTTTVSEQHQPKTRADIEAEKKIEEVRRLVDKGAQK